MSAVDDLERDLRRLGSAADPVPEHVRALAYAAIGTRHLDEALAVLVADSATAEGAAGDAVGAFAAVRGDGEQGSRLLSFDSGATQVDLEVVPDGAHFTLFGQLTGALPEDCVLEYPDGRRRPVPVDSLGRILLSAVEPGTVRLRYRSVEGTGATGWVSL
jgi:hypothetical protein